MAVNVFEKWGKNICVKRYNATSERMTPPCVFVRYEKMHSSVEPTEKLSGTRCGWWVRLW